MSRVMQSSVFLKRTATVLGIAVLGGALLACAPRLDSRGNKPDPDRLAEIVPGEGSREEVSEILGSPSSVAVFDQETWFYISQRTETLAFLEPELKEREIIILRFDDKGILAAVETRSAEDGKDVLPVDRKTPTAGNEINFFEQIFGNLGRFNK
ncbi:MAG: outer membrane protein assembly factor BamE [Rhodospirillaceae bacterium]|nr:outer membrane protein assembly factor BamE [Rhodospirillaceae bacterium]